MLAYMIKCFYKLGPKSLAKAARKFAFRAGISEH